MRFLGRQDIVLAGSSVALGLAGAAVFAIYRAVSLSEEAIGGRLEEFAANMLWPGVLIFGAVAVVVFGGWKANLD